MAAAEKCVTNPQQTATIQQEEEYKALIRNYNKLKEMLHAEQEKNAKLRRYIARINHPSTPESQSRAPTETESLQKLVQEQNQLLEKLYNENANHQQSLERTTLLNRQLLVANDKLRQTLLDSKKRIKAAPQGANEKGENNTGISKKSKVASEKPTGALATAATASKNTNSTRKKRWLLW